MSWPFRQLGALFAALVMLSLPLATACGDPPRTCGKGTVLKAGKCVVPKGPSCGQNTHLEDGVCVVDTVVVQQIQCGAGTVQLGDQCVAVDAGPQIVDRCAEGTQLLDDTCVPIPVGEDASTGCQPDCLGRVCGDNGCGGSCGACEDPGAPLCDTATGQCEAVCVPQCAGKNCGGDGCGGVCGTCLSGETCTDVGLCLPLGWSCDSEWFADGAVCDCGCGGGDPDCELGRPVAGCEEEQVCNSSGVCVSRVPATWTCAPQAYDARDSCHCGCGAYDPDCDLENLGIVGCGTGVTSCNSDGSCAQCVADCQHKTCGDDGCGGSCGTCGVGSGLVCADAACVDACDPSPVRCRYNDCGDDGCGGSCGTCASGSSCVEGQCALDFVEIPPNSCLGRCGSTAPSGCYCVEGCAENGSCCPDFAQHCECTPSCDGKSCGSDGCNGSCGVCGGATPFCVAGQCTDQCTPNCTNRSCGGDGCGGSCGTCAEEATCHWTAQCVPHAWDCDATYYADQRGCDCGCGMADPDCSTQDATLFGCPTQSSQCTEAGLCDDTLCHSNAECPNGQWCTGVYFEGDHRFAGYCAATTSEADVPGTPCVVNEQCASNACVAGQCRLHCGQDSDCPTMQVCLAQPVRDEGTGQVRGYAGVCELVLGTAQSCQAQADCTSGERCIAMMEAQALTPRLLCVSLTDPNAQGRSCEERSCPAGYRCEQAASGRVCTLPCPADSADCAGGDQCTTVPFAPLLNNATQLPVCLPQ